MVMIRRSWWHRIIPLASSRSCRSEPPTDKSGMNNATLFEPGVPFTSRYAQWHSQPQRCEQLTCVSFRSHAKVSTGSDERRRPFPARGLAAAMQHIETIEYDAVTEVADEINLCVA